MKQFQFTDIFGQAFPVRTLIEATAGMEFREVEIMVSLPVGGTLTLGTGVWARLPDLEPQAEAYPAETDPVPSVDVPSAAERTRLDNFVLAIYPVVAQQYLAGQLQLEPGVSLTQCVVTNALALIAELEARS